MSLARIQETLENVAKAIQAALGVHVTIVDVNFEKLVSTIGSLGSINSGSANAKSINERKLIFIDAPRTHEACVACGDKEICKQFAEICAPIIDKDVAIGVIGLIAYTEKERNYLIEREEGVKDFLEQMSRLIVSKLNEESAQMDLVCAHEELDLLFDNLQRGVVFTNIAGEVLRYNALANRLLDLKSNPVLPKELLQGEADEKVFNRQFVWLKAPIRRGQFDRHGMVVRSQQRFVFFIESLGEAIQRYQAFETHPLKLTFGDVDGNGPKIQKAIGLALKASKTVSTVLIQGESGTGKEVFARAIHYASSRQDKPFVAINCGAIPENLLESELFGYEAGSFTGANKAGKPGKFELANGGTVFLDEIGEMPLNLQVKMLRVLQERTVERVGSISAIPIDVRIICATHRNLEKMVAEGEFREDLFYRIQVVPLTIPPLRERVEDIVAILEKLLRLKLDRMQLDHKITVSETVIDIFKEHRWPGNIRELENVVEYALNIDTDGVINPDDLPNRFFVSSGKGNSDRKFQTLDAVEKEMILAALSQFGKEKEGIQQICSTLGISRASLYRKLSQYNKEQNSKLGDYR